MTTLGSLFTGYGGLDMGVMTALDPSARVAWTSDIEAGPCKLAATRWPDTPNLGDITAIDWANAEPVDIICGGSPCQDLSVAGKRAGMAPGTRSGLWESMFAAIKTIRPRLVVWENVQGALSARSNSSVEPRPGMLGNEPARPTVRAAGRVVGDLATIGYDACWHVVRAVDAAGHQRGALIRRLRAEPPRDSHERRPDGVRSLRGGNRPMGNHYRARSTSAVNGITPPRRKPAAIRPVRRVAYGPSRRTRYRRGPSPTTRTATPAPR